MLLIDRPFVYPESSVPLLIKGTNPTLSYFLNNRKSDD